jgi:sugar (pentulose or hexulose) kinase
VAYTNEVPEGVHERFWAAMGNSDEVQAATATAEIKPLINMGKLLWYQKERWPEEFSRIDKILLYPQYFGYRLTGKAAADITYTGCHSYLWDFGKKDWSGVVDRLGVRNAFPEKPGAPESELGVISHEVAAATGLSPDTKVTLGIHDSNSSLIPYLITQKQDFVLNSTGTWCVAMHPVEKVSFEAEELGKTVFYNLSYAGKPVKTSILLGGLEYATYTDVLMKHHSREDWPDYDPSMYRDILADPHTFILPTVVPGTGQFPESVARVIDGDEVFPVADILEGRRWPKSFEDYLTGFALANLSLAIQTKIALQRVGLEPGTEVFIEGGFRQNQNYGALLGALLPDNPLFLTELEEATSYGAALCGKSLADGVSVESLRDFVSLEKKPIKPADLQGLEGYVQAFLGHLEN